jgi:hypothetical protein
VKTLLAIALLLAMPALAHADRDTDRIRVAIVPGIAVNLDAARVDALSQELAGALATELDVDAIGGLEVRRKLPAEGIPPDCVATPACVQDVGQRLGANQLLFVVMVDTGAGGAVQIDSTWIDVASGQRASRPAIDIATIAEAKARFIAAAPKLLPDAPVREKPKPVDIGGMMTPAVPRHFTTPAKITAGVAVVGLGLGIGMGLRARSLYNKCDSPMAMCDSGDEKSIRTAALVADLGYIVAIGGAVATGILFATSAEDARLIVAPSVEGSGQGVSVTAMGRF